MIQFVYKGGKHYYVDDGMHIELVDVLFGDMTCSGDDPPVQEYEITGPKGQETIDWLREKVPGVRYVDPRREKADALAMYHEAIGRQAVEKYKKEIEADLALAAIMRRYITENEAGYDSPPYLAVKPEHMTLDGKVKITPEELEVVADIIREM